jgi:hypothetical protein
MKVFETENSKYEIKEGAGGDWYRRSPIFQQEIQSERLTYGDWHPLKSWSVVYGRLHIMHETSTLGILTSEIRKQYEE